MVISNYQGMVIGSHSTCQLLRTIFSNVYFAVNAKEALIELQSNHHQPVIPTILIIDTENENRNILMLRMIIQFLKNGSIENVIPLVSSSNELSEYMMKCVDNGAAGYLLKPLRHNVLQTIFLYAHKYKPPVPCDLPCYKKLDKCWYHHKDRIKDIFSNQEQHWLMQAVIDFHIPQYQEKQYFDISKLTSQRKKELAHQLCQWDFLSTEYSDLDLIYCTLLIFEQAFQLPDMAPYKLPHDKLLNFFHDIWHAYYKSNPYHCYYHVLDVLQAMYYCLCKMGLLSWVNKSTTTSSSFSPYKYFIDGLDILALLLACIGHDIGHPGVTNGFMTNTRTSLALLYNDQSVLENFHSMLLCHLIQRYWPADKYKDQNIVGLRTKIIKGILSTDIALHKNHIDKIKHHQQALINTIKNSNHQSTLSEDEKTTLLNGLIKCVDISNIARPFPIAKIWAERLVKELHQQGDIEKELGMTSLQIHQRGEVSLPHFQKQFIDQVGEGLYKTISDIVPELGFCLEIIQKNRLLWDEE
ncbi:hypothetical protein BJ944DRAFT_179493 [Cunninghamella echinulata]|nr:hypothetical protein BJ944DRAFT_179493 [Cunninghamella echinulata]